MCCQDLGDGAWVAHSKGAWRSIHGVVVVVVGGVAAAAYAYTQGMALGLKTQHLVVVRANTDTLLTSRRRGKVRV